MKKRIKLSGILAGAVIIVIITNLIMAGCSSSIKLNQYNFNENWRRLDKGKTSIVMIDHSTCLIRTNGMTILADPWFGGAEGLYSRSTPLKFSMNNLPGVDLILITHNHWDHFDKEALSEIAKKNSKTTLFIPESNLEEAEILGFEQIIGAKHWETTKIGNLEITPIPLVHMTESVGYVIEGEKNIFFAGDTEGNDTYFEAIKTLSDKFDIYTAMLPSVGPKAFGGLVRTSLTTQETMKTLEILSPEYMVPIHWGLKPKTIGKIFFFVRIDGNPFELARKIEKQNIKTQVKILGRGEGWILE